MRRQFHQALRHERQREIQPADNTWGMSRHSNHLIDETEFRRALSEAFQSTEVLIVWQRHEAAHPTSEEAKFLCAIAHQHILCLLIITQHHFVILAPNPGLLIASESCMRRIGVIAIRPNATSLN